MNVTIYFEGGGDGEALKTLARKGLSRFLERMGFKGRMPKIVACGSRNSAFDRFQTAVSQPSSKDGNLVILLVDSEDEIVKDAWTHLNERDGWMRPTAANDEQIQLMVRCMEAWFLADTSALKRYFGKGFAEAGLLKGRNIEDIDRKEINTLLQRATRDTAKIRISQGRDSFRILAELNPHIVIAASPHAKRLFDTLDKKL